MAYDLGLAERVRSILHRRAGFSERKMFGGIGFMINGHMCCGVMKTDLMVRLAPEGVDAAYERPHTRPMQFTDKPMKSLLLVDCHGTDSDEDLDRWVASAYAFARTLPPKEPAAPKRRADPPARRSRPAL